MTNANDQYVISMALNNLGVTYLGRDNFDKALAYFQQAYKKYCDQMINMYLMGGCGVRGLEVERRPLDPKVLSSIPGSGYRSWFFHWPTHSARVLVNFPGSRIERD